MEFEVWWLLAIPVIFGLGWAASRFDVKSLLSESSNLPRSYFRGLNFLLNEQPDKAIDAFIEVAKLDPETTELHFALGSLFRRRGETERAIRVHQNLLSRDDLPVSEQEHALFDLGQDFLKAGLLDRAEEAFQRLQTGSFAKQAQHSVLAIYQIEKEWHKALECATRLAADDNSSYQKEISQFHCELAQEALQRKDAAAASAEIEAALRVNPANVRAMLLRGDTLLHNGDAAGALAILSEVPRQNPTYVGFAAGRLMRAYEALGRAADGIVHLRDMLSHYPSDELAEVVFEKMMAQDGPDAAYAVVRSEMKRAPSVQSAVKLLTAHHEHASEPQQADLAMVREWLLQRTKNLPRYVCEQCGFRARFFYWQCPGCGGWETYVPRRADMPASS
ncbi:MAG: lipopolysaccharide assembly protein LapB [Burkholderiales bacterium]|nr:lipopolysaccharide assembly protein LapB [Burkholderiales bacterium]